MSDPTAEEVLIAVTENKLRRPTTRRCGACLLKPKDFDCGICGNTRAHFLTSFRPSDLADMKDGDTLYGMTLKEWTELVEDPSKEPEDGLTRF